MSELVAAVELEVPFHDVDAMEVAWHGHYLKYFEVARCALLRRFDYDYPQMQASGYLWPIVDCRIKYVKPARYGQRLRIEARLSEYENRFKIDYHITSAPGDETLSKGHTIQIAVDARTGETQFIVPPLVVDKVRKALE
jgi:acyl-CoA thioester hydrolase